ncbi:hypothetical protein CIK66_18420 [Brachybacterium alimentarium]|uniref:Uncharacterized protein n=1 Tax=Brachybacterium alimentarium TaxID=47845 RepID=A0A2A3YE94_9MICO|nr:hypothetical protein [Brachybacterium alimentarium]PCC37614.1 hypothetical protein CIK66_18420 [Brachybacterium alimentarium]
MLFVVIALYTFSAALSLVGMIRPWHAARREAAFASRAQQRHGVLYKHWMEVAGGAELADEQSRRHATYEKAMNGEFESSGQTLRSWVETVAFDPRVSNAHAARTAFQQSKSGLMPIAGGVLTGAVASLLSLTL